MRPCQLRPESGTSRTRSYLLTGEYDFTASKKYVYFTDHQGNVRDLMDADAGTRVGALDYDAYGTLRDSSGTLPDFRYAGLLWVPEMGLYASSTRFYDPGTTRWLNRDWIREQGGINMYAYAEGNPVMWIDPMGTTLAIPAVIIAGGAIVGLAALYSYYVIAPSLSNNGGNQNKITLPVTWCCITHQIRFTNLP